MKFPDETGVRTPVRQIAIRIRIHLQWKKHLVHVCPAAARQQWRHATDSQDWKTEKVK